MNKLVLLCLEHIADRSTESFHATEILGPRGSVVKYLTRYPGVMGSSSTGSSGFFRGSVFGQDTSEPSLVLVKPRKDNNVSCRRDMTEILLKAA